MATQIIHWQASDGSMFDTEDEADVHDLKQSICETFLKMADRHSIVFEDNEDAFIMLLDYLNADKAVLRAYLFPETY